MLEQSNGLLVDEKALHEFCRLIARLKSNAQLHELIRIDDYPPFMEKLFRFTLDHVLNMHAPRSFRLSPSTLHYVLSYWSKIIAYISYSSKLSDSNGSPTPHLLDIYIPQLITYYIQTRLEALNNDELLYTELFDNDLTVLQQQLEMIGTMSKLDYTKTCSLLCTCFDDIAQEYQQVERTEGDDGLFDSLCIV